MNKYSIIISLILISTFVYGQQSDNAIKKIALNTVIETNQGESYTTFPTDIGNIEKLWFEGNIIPNFYIRESKNSRLIGVFTPQIIIRMYQEESFPVRTPSYKPQITIYYEFSPKKSLNSFSWFGKLAHHSNGQEGDFYLDNGDINLLTGNFSTNYYESGLISASYNSDKTKVRLLSTSLEVHPPKLTIDELSGIYAVYRWNTMFSFFKQAVKSDNKKQKATISLKAKTTWMFGELNNYNAYSLNRLNLSFTFFYRPSFLEDLGLFAQIYHGEDYYNIYFDHQITVLRFGIMTEKLKF